MGIWNFIPVSFFQWMTRKAWDYEKFRRIPGAQISGFFFSKNQWQFLCLRCYICNIFTIFWWYKKPDTNRWIKLQIDILVSLRQENIGVLESTRSLEMWVKIKAAVDNLGPAKTIKQCKDKMLNLKDIYKRAKKNRSWCKLHLLRRN